MSTPQDTLTWLTAWLGYTETGTNVQHFDDLAGHGQDLAWCATFRVAGHRCTDTPIPPGGGSAYTPANWAAYRRAGQLVAHDQVQPGDLFWVGYASFEGRRPHGIGHEGVVREVLDGRTIQTIEGNTNQGASRTGGQVASLTRDIYDRGSARVVAFARPRWDGVHVVPRHLPVVADHTGQIIAVPAYKPVPGHLLASSSLVVDGALGPATTRRWQEVMGTTTDGTISRPSELVRAVQQRLNAAIGAGLAVDGLGVAQDGRKYKTVAALQAYLGSVQDGVLSAPVSVAVMRLQERLNTGRF